MKPIIKNFTFSLPTDLLNKLKKYSSDGHIPSVNAAVREALEAYVKQLEKQHLYDQMQAATQDPMFVKDLQETMNDFYYADFEATKETEK